MKSEKRRIRYSIKAAICLLVLFAMILAPWAYFSRKAAIEKADDVLLQRREMITDNLRTTINAENYYEDDFMIRSAMVWATTPDPAYRYTDEDGDTFSIDSVSFPGYNYAFSAGWNEIFNFSYLDYGFNDYGIIVQDDDAFTNAIIDEMRSLNLEGLNTEENLMGEVSGFRYLVTKASIQMHDIDHMPSSSKPIEKTWYEDRYVLLTEDTAPYLQDWKENLEKNSLALLITLLTAFSIIFILEERSGAKGFYMTPKEEEAEAAVSEETEKEAEFMTSDAAKALLAELDSAEQAMGENGYTKQIRQEISRYL